MTLPTVSRITRQQVVSIVKNAVIAGLAAFAVALQQSGDVSKPALIAGLTAAVTAIVKVVEKAFTEA